LSSVDESRKRRFEIIKIIYGNLTIRHRPNSTYKEIAEIMMIPEHEVSAEIKVLGNAGFVRTLLAYPIRIVYLTPDAVKVMERRPQPTNYDEFTMMIQNPQREFGEGITIKGPKESPWKKHKGIIITIIVGL